MLSIENGIFCLACADELQNDVAAAAETIYRKLMQLPQRNAQFRLVLLVSSLQHHISTSFAEVRFVFEM